jgi:hypothetical protein
MNQNSIFDNQLKINVFDSQKFEKLKNKIEILSP